MNTKMSNKLCYPFLIIVFFLFNLNDSRALMAYDYPGGDPFEIVDDVYYVSGFMEGQEIEYFDFEDNNYKTAIIDDMEDNFSSIELEVTEVKGGRVRKLFIDTGK